MSDPTSFTLRFKHGKATILLLATPLTTFSTILQDLLEVLRERYPSGLLSQSSFRIPIPDSIMDLTLGVAKDTYDLSKGFEELDIGGTGVSESPRSLGLKEGAAIAFSLPGEKGEFWIEMPDLEALYPEEE